MFPMNDTVRKNLETQIRLSTQLADQIVDVQVQSMTAAQKQFNANFDAFRSMFDVQTKAARAMQQTLVDGFFPAETAAA